MANVEDILDYRFKDSTLLEEALTHPSCNEQRNNLPFHYQRLEFLGDSIIGTVVSELLFRLHPEEAEGSLAKRKAALVSSYTISKIVQDHKLASFIRLSESEQSDGGHNNHSIQEDVCEALMGAIYLDGGYSEAHRVINRLWSPYCKELTSVPQDPKTTLQEWAQGCSLPLPNYQVIDEQGPAHAPEFTIEVSVEGFAPEQATAGSKRKAEQKAAKLLLKKLPIK